MGLNFVRPGAIAAACCVLAGLALPRWVPAQSEPQVGAAAQSLVESLDFDRFRQNIRTLAGFGTRYWNTEGNASARDWLVEELESYGYDVERHAFRATGRPEGSVEPTEVDNIYATKVGTRFPDRMFIISGHMDSFNTESEDQSFAPGANDDASGTSIVLEAARVFADFETAYSIRFILWNAEEIGLVGSEAYAEERRELQGLEFPPGSGMYPEPTWMGVIQHDMMMFDHGVPPSGDELPGVEQDPRADVDIEYQADSLFAGAARELAARLLIANARYATDYPAEVGQNMSSTDSASFSDYVPAISLRENQRRSEIGRGSNPNWHKNSDVPETYSEDDYRLGFNALQMTVGALAELAGARVSANRR